MIKILVYAPHPHPSRDHTRTTARLPGWRGTEGPDLPQRRRSGSSAARSITRGAGPAVSDRRPGGGRPDDANAGRPPPQDLHRPRQGGGAKGLAARAGLRRARLRR